MFSRFLKPEKQFEILSSGVVDFIQKKELLKKLKEKRALRVKVGFDPSRPDIHLGHSVLLNKLRQFQDLGHKVIFVVGDFTACIGDPSGQNKTRPLLSEKEARRNARTYIEQVTQKNFENPKDIDMKTTHLLNFLKRLNIKKTKILYNSKWLDKLPLRKFIIEIMSKLTVARQLERNDFAQRYKSEKSIGLHEFFYPALQAYDSLEIKADVELGGTDQLFNLLLGRELQEHFNQVPQCVLTLPLLEGVDGVQKMSKSLGNAISFNDLPRDIYGKVMKISDKLLTKYWSLLTQGFCDLDKEINKKKLHPKSQKELLAESIVYSLHGEKAAQEAKKEFVQIFSKKGTPTDIKQKIVKPAQDVWICSFIKEVGLSSSTSEARRSILAGALKKDGQKLTNAQEKINLKSGDSFILNSGKRKFIKIKVK